MIGSRPLDRMHRDARVNARHRGAVYRLPVVPPLLRSRTMPSLPVSLLLFATLLSGAAVAQTAPSSPSVGGGVGPAVVTPVEVPVVETAREQVLVLLSAHHGLPERERFEALVDDPAAVLFSLVSETDLNPIFWDRAVAALAMWPSDAVRSLYVALLAEPPREMVRHRVIGHAVVAFGDSAVPLVSPYLQDADVQLRLTTVDVLGHLATPAAFEALDAVRSQESSPVVLERIERATLLR